MQSLALFRPTPLIAQSQPPLTPPPPRNLTRLITNDVELQDARQGFLSLAARLGVRIQFCTVDFAKLSFEEQVALAQDTDCWIVAHGAGFSHLLYLRRRSQAAVLELKRPERRGGESSVWNLASNGGGRAGRLKRSCGEAGTGVTPKDGWLDLDTILRIIHISICTLHIFMPRLFSVCLGCKSGLIVLVNTLGFLAAILTLLPDPALREMYITKSTKLSSQHG
ncbi:hypothetical protein BC830DRAFT_1079510 [Chytriomyces sp. MP71]|nr:hypothetical protein BC830DRAFT_1079510 [Chytriomyces sp. MP71]